MSRTKEFKWALTPQAEQVWNFADQLATTIWAINDYCMQDPKRFSDLTYEDYDLEYVKTATIRLVRIARLLEPGS